MSVKAVIGAQWGDEGKGKITDLLAQDADFVIRFNGGNNAGHTVKNEHGEFKLHIMPSGVFNPDTVNIIGSGTFVDVHTLVEEIASLRKAGIAVDNLFISKKAHLVMPWHIDIDEAQELKRSDKDKIGTTKRGIGPTSGDKYARHNLRVGDLLDKDLFAKKFEEYFYFADKRLKSLYGHIGLVHPPIVLMREFWESAQEIVPLIRDTEEITWKALDDDKNILLEGAQAVLLDVDYGSYPFVTSSACTVASAAQGSGIPPSLITERIAVVKAYSTRIGPGAFPTFEKNSLIDIELRERGNEYGATTGRPRMCAWLDIPLLRYAARLNDFTALAITKLDVLSGINPLWIGLTYECLQTSTHSRCTHTDCGINGATALTEEIRGWARDISEIRERIWLPWEAEAYVQLIEDQMQAPAKFISVGPERDQTIIC
ncbi:MAG: adenylosuccinate synthase [Candidatus Spechtbacterales bacterium]|nr:adenylosuccinate synthase [Candidatus Spechtbacterales bacterium]